MVAGYISLGILCIFYYCFVAWYTRKMNSTFSWFWIALGIWYFLLAILTDILPDFGDYMILAVGILIGVIFVAIETLILCAMIAMPQKKMDYIIVLGAQIRGTVITGTLRRRLDKALTYLKNNEDTICIVAGGQGKGEAVTEAKAMADYLMGCGVAEERILLENQSTSTYENILNSFEMLDHPEEDKVGIVTNNFHMYRALKYAKIVGFEKIYAIVASCDVVLFLNYMVREFFAVLLMFLKYRKKNK